jgi:cysteinyl-tRNA synthetase
MRPDFEPRATEYIGQMVAMIAGLIASGHAYEAAGHVLFRVRSYAGYGKLSGRSVDDMIAGARVEVAPFKEDPMDFVLWKPSSGEEPGWPSPWGKGRPGWHIECSAMAHELLGESFDIHGGGLDLQFPHHENEIAQSACAHPHGDFAHYWLHNEMLQVEGKKMSKSLGNFFTVRDLLDQGVPGEVIRFVFLMTHYRSPMDWTAEKARQAEVTLRKIAEFLGSDPFTRPWVDRRFAKAPTEFVEALANDLNTSLALTLLSKYLKNMEEMNLVGALRLLGFNEQFVEQKFVSFRLGARDHDDGSTVSLRSYGALTQSNEDLLLLFTKRFSKLREQAAVSKDFSAVDAMKSALIAAGVEVRMSKDGVELVPGPNFDPTKLEALQ